MSYNKKGSNSIRVASFFNYKVVNALNIINIMVDGSYSFVY